MYRLFIPVLIACSGAEQVDPSACPPATWWLDADGDGAGDAALTVDACAPPAGYTDNADDCDDQDADNHPGNPERCDELDQDCSGVADDGLPLVAYWIDADGDGAGNEAAVARWTCSEPPGGSTLVGGDCDDLDPGRFPGNPERCDGLDQDCSGSADNGLVTRDYWLDDDGDGLGSDALPPVASCAETVEGRVRFAGDCDDADSDRFLGNPERCDGRDQDCIGGSDNGLLFVDYWPDADGDGYGDEGSRSETCGNPPADSVSVGDDCDDSVADVHPGADASSCDRVDTDCDGVIEELRLPEDYGDLQSAIDAASDGDLICVAAGVWDTNADLHSKDDLVVHGDPGAILDGSNGLGPVLDLLYADGTEVSGFEITGALVDEGALSALYSFGVVFRDLVVSGNRCEANQCDSAGVYVGEAEATLERVVISDNEATADDWVTGVGLYIYDSAVSIEDVTVSGNLGIGDAVQSVGVRISGADVVANRLSIADNFAAGDVAEGVALNTCEGASTLDLTDVVIQGNEAVSSGADIHIVALCNTPSDTFTRLTIRENEAASILRVTDVVIDNLLMVENEAYGRPLIEVDAELELEHATIAGNVFGQTLSSDPTIFESPGGGLTLHDSIVAYNTWDYNALDEKVFSDSAQATYTDIYASGSTFPFVFSIRTENPQFAADYDLSAGSPLIGIADPANVDPNGDRYDLGAFSGPYAFP